MLKDPDKPETPKEPKVPSPKVEDPSVGRHYVFEGDVVVARITEYPTRKSAAVVTIERRVGSAEDLDMNVEATIASYGLATEFPDLRLIPRGAR